MPEVPQGAPPGERNEEEEDRHERPGRERQNQPHQDRDPACEGASAAGGFAPDQKTADHGRRSDEVDELHLAEMAPDCQEEDGQEEGETRGQKEQVP